MNRFNVNFMAAFTSVIRDALLYKLIILAALNKFIGILKCLYDDTTAQEQLK